MPLLDTLIYALLLQDYASYATISITPLATIFGYIAADAFSPCHCLRLHTYY